MADTKDRAWCPMLKSVCRRDTCALWVARADGVLTPACSFKHMALAIATYAEVAVLSTKLRA